MQRDHVILYDSDCGFCRWSLAKLLAWDKRGDRRLEPMAIQDVRAATLLADVPADDWLESWHLVTPEGAVYSAGEAEGHLFRLLPRGRGVARLLEAAPGVTNRTYRWVADHRVLMGKPPRALSRLTGKPYPPQIEGGPTDAPLGCRR